jgi:hypothetical protein
MQAVEGKIIVAHDTEPRCRETVIGENFFCSRFIQTDVEGEGITRGVRNFQMLEDGGDVSFAARTIGAFGDIENNIRPRLLPFALSILTGINQDNLVAFFKAA